MSGKSTCSRPIRSLLIANRGEIAVRVIRAARELGIHTIAVYSDADRVAAHVLAADEAHRIGPAPAGESYLRGEALIELALRRGAEAIHPGYGFLSERADFAEAVEVAGLVFVGPTPSTIAAMGDKSEARRRMVKAGVPVVPGSPGPVPDADSAVRFADQIGYPVLLKAVAGGGGKGMRMVDSRSDVRRAFEAARREAEAAFGEGAIYVERYLARPRHIEVQILGDAYGNVIHLGERECSIQRRHQKLVEECPSPGITPNEREQVCEAAVLAARVTSYRGAGTVEFLYEDGAFHFLEMNTRIQVEHPITELVTGIDLIHAQLRVAMGEELPLTQAEVRAFGHAIECRITAEDATFLPSSGRVGRMIVPAGPGVRWDGGIEPGQEVTLHYDSLLGKLITHAPDRDGAISRMERALSELVITGVETAGRFHRRLMADPDFRSGDLSICFLEERPELAGPEPPASELGEGTALAALAACLLESERLSSGVMSRVPRRLGGSWVGETSTTSGAETWTGLADSHELGTGWTRLRNRP